MAGCKVALSREGKEEKGKGRKRGGGEGKKRMRGRGGGGGEKTLESYLFYLSTYIPTRFICKTKIL